MLVLPVVHVTVGDATGPAVLTTDAVSVPVAPPTTSVSDCGATVTEVTVTSVNVAVTLRA